jgi:signal transduction histidine kinase
MYQKHRLHRLRTQLVLSFLISSLGIGIAIGMPVILLINRQASSQAHLLLDQGTLTTRVFLAGEQSDLQNLALLISQRPTLTRLLEEKDFASLKDYLKTLGEGANLDLVLVCDDDQEVAGFGGDDPTTQLCAAIAQTGYATLAPGDELYLYTSVDLELPQQPAYKIIAGKKTSSILAGLQNEIGLVYFLIRQGQVVNSSDPSIEPTSVTATELLNKTSQPSNVSLQRRAIRLNTNQYILAVLEIDPSLDIDLINALNIDNQIAVQQNLNRSLILGMFIIVLIAFGLGVWQAQRISRPIVELADSAEKFRQGNLDAPVVVQSSVREISQLANTLEDARITLQHSMQQLQAEKAWIEHLLNSIVEGTLTLDNQNRITFASAGVGKILECELDKIIGRKVDEVFVATEEEIAFSGQLPSAGQQTRVSIKLNNGQERLLSISKTNLVPPVASDANRALVIRDVSNEEYIHRLLGDFMANITHEFRTPLSALEASSELLLDNLHSLSKTEIEELLISLNLGIINLQTLIDNLIEASSIEAGRFKVSIQSVPFDSILKESQEMIQPLIEKYNLRLVVSPVTESLLVRADQRRTVQVLVNLLSNAIKHSPEGGHIQVNHFLSEKAIRVEITDEGGGVPLNQRGNLFRRFSHLDMPNEHTRQGAGLGLSVVKAIVEAQQGEVGMTDIPKGGTSFWFTLPWAGGGQ